MKKTDKINDTENDCDFIKGQIKIKFTPQYDSGYFIVTKGNIKKQFTLEKYCDLELRNWTSEIDKAITKKDKLHIVNNAILQFSKDLLNEYHPLIQSLKEKHVQYLKECENYIKNSTYENPQPQQNENNKNEQPQPEIKPTFKTETNSEIKQFIIDEFKNLDNNKGWEYAFKNEKDYSLFLELLTNFFESNPYTIPETINLTRDCKTRLAQTLKPIHKKFSGKELISDKEFFTIIKVLNHFKTLTDVEIYKSLTR